MSTTNREKVRFSGVCLLVEPADKYMQYKEIMTPRGAEQQESFQGRDRDIKHFDLLRLVRDVGHKVGLTGSDIQYLDYLISHTKEVDWTTGERPVVYKSVCKIARERGVSERQIHNREAKLHRLGCLSWNDLGNFRRTGCRDRSGRIAFAYGVDLSPLAARYEEFVGLKEQHRKDLLAFDEARRRVSSVRRRVLVKITQAQEQGLSVGEIVERFSGLPKVRAGTSPVVLESILTTASELETALDEALSVVPPTCGQHPKTSDQPEENFRHIQPTNNPQSSKDDTCNRLVASRPTAWTCQPVDYDREDCRKKPEAEGLASTGIEHLKLWQITAATSETFSAIIEPTGRAVRMSDIVDAACRYCHHLGIHRTAWADACSVMGRDAAAVAVIIIERNLTHPETPIKRPGGVLRAMTARARADELNLHRSIFGILDRDGQGGAS